MLAVTVALAAAGLIVVLSQSPVSRLSSDFTINYSAGVLVREGHLAAPYDQSQLAETMRRVAPNGAIDPGLPFSLPLAAALPYAVVSLLPIELAFRLWQLLTITLLLVAVVLLQRAAPIRPSSTSLGLALLGLLAAVPTWATLTEGQPTGWLLLGGAMVMLAVRWESPMLAAGAGLLLAVKPQYLPAYLAVLFAARQWRSLAAAAVAGGLLLMSPLAGGVSGLSAMIHNAMSANQAVAVRFNEAWVGVFGPALPPRAATMLAIVLYLAVLVMLWMLAWRRPTSVIGFATLAGALTVLVSPHALPHDLLILAVPAWLAIVLYRAGALPNPLPGLLAIDFALLVDLRGLEIPLGPVAITAALVWYCWQFRQRAEQRRRPPIGRAA
ncbi:MAG: glycosyltransferase 87 family protein [Candidatus Dormibacteraeota bacterium]|nr:glycosyltransferase 87 family protein [Candidatus Dormibacteraeota bacterium]